MGDRGPIPNRSEDLARPRERKGGDAAQAITKGVLRDIEYVLPPSADWHQVATTLYLSLANSGQSDYYQESDWALAWSLCDDLSHYKKAGRRSAQMAATIYSALSSLMVSEGDRRRVRLELQPAEDDAEDAALYAIEDYKNELGVD
jgi:hypothetical protein